VVDFESTLGARPLGGSIVESVRESVMEP